MNARERIDAHIAALAGWKGALLARLRRWIREADPALVEGWKWNTPVWSRDGNVVACGAFRDHVKLNFFDGAALPDPRAMFNAGLDARRSRAIDLREGDVVDEAAFKELVRAASALDRTRRAPPVTAKTATKGISAGSASQTRATGAARPRKAR